MTADYASSLQHLRLLEDKRRSLHERKLAAEQQFVHRVGVDHRAGRLTVEDLVALYAEYRESAMVGFGQRWNAAVDVSWNQLRQFRWQQTKATPAASDDWSGRYVLDADSAYPADGTAVVYVLYSATWDPCYVGSTGHFRARLRAHRREKNFEFWRAWRCLDRADAYVREADMLAEVMPSLNRRRPSRQGSPA